MLGSHNFSMAAWGRFSLRNDVQNLHIKSYELSVLALPRLEAAYRRSAQYGFSCTAPHSQAGPQPGVYVEIRVLVQAGAQL
jgi:hypothetical protein